MLKAGRGLKETFPNLKHITCLVHALSQVCEEIKGIYEEVNKFIASMKATLSKSHVRRQKFSEICHLPFPPEVIETRWNSWMNAAFYYAKNFSAVKSFALALDDDVKCVKQLQACIKKDTLEKELLEIYKYQFLPEAITRLEKRNLTAEDQMAIFSSVKQKLSGCVLIKLEVSISKNPDINFYESLPVDKKIKMMYAPMTSVDVERSFSLYRYILSDRRRSLTESHLAMLNVIQYNNFIDDIGEKTN